MKKLLAMVFATLLVVLGVQPAKAADVTFTVKLTGSSESFLGASVSLTSSSANYVQKLTVDGTASFSVPPGTYAFTVAGNTAVAMLGLNLAQQLQVTAPGDLRLQVPQARYTNVRYVLPNGKLLPGIWVTDNSTSKITTSDGIDWYSKLGQAVSSANGVTKYRVYVAPNSHGTNAWPEYDTDGDGYYDPRISLATANGGYQILNIPSSKWINGGDVEIADASYLVFDQGEAKGASGSTFTLTGHIENIGKGSSGTMIGLFLASSQTFGYQGNMMGPGIYAGVRKPANPDGTFALQFVLRKTPGFVTANQFGAQFSFPSEIIPVTVTAAKSSYKSCATLNMDFQGGVTLDYNPKNRGAATKYSPTWNSRLYAAVKSLDLDKDGIACEK